MVKSQHTCQVSCVDINEATYSVSLDPETKCFCLTMLWLYNEAIHAMQLPFYIFPISSRLFAIVLLAALSLLQLFQDGSQN